MVANNGGSEIGKLREDVGYNRAATEANGEAIRELNSLFRQHCADDERRHRENQSVAAAMLVTMGEMSGNLRAIKETPKVAAIGDAVGHIGGMSRFKFAAFATLGIGVFAITGALITALINQVLGAAFAPLAAKIIAWFRT